MAGCEGEPRELVSLRAVERSVDPGVSIDGIWKVGPPRADDEAAVVAAGALILSSGNGGAGGALPNNACVGGPNPPNPLFSFAFALVHVIGGIGEADTSPLASCIDTSRTASEIASSAFLSGESDERPPPPPWLVVNAFCGDCCGLSISQKARLSEPSISIGGLMHSSGKW